MRIPPFAKAGAHRLAEQLGPLNLPPHLQMPPPPPMPLQTGSSTQVCVWPGVLVTWQNAIA